jgi:outer membrane protein assembly factor BamB
LPITFSETENLVWRTEIHGKGWSSPVVWGNQIWLTTATKDGKQMSVVCADLQTGELIRDFVVFENEAPDFCHPTNSYATPTPALEEGRVFVHFGSYGTACVDTESGEVLWTRTDLACNHFRGPASSPILFENLLIVALDGFDQQYVVALDSKTGQIVWRTDRKIQYETDNGDLKKAYGTGSVFTVDGQPLLVYPSAVATEAYHPKTGERIWICYHDGMNASARPVKTDNGLVLITNGMGRMVAVRPSGTGDITDSHVAWGLSKTVPKKSSLLVVEGLLYMVDDKGVVSCVDPLTGAIVWQERVGGSFAASPIYADGKIYCCSEEGMVYVLKPGNKYELLAKSKLGDGFNASPAVVGDQLIFRSISSLYCVKNLAENSQR